jgi:hypothetical protein
MRRALTLLLFIALACVLFAPPARAENGDSVDVKANADAPPPQAEETAAGEEPIPPEKLVEPPPESKPMPKKWVTPQIKFKFKEFYQPLPTAEEWEAVMRAILGGTPAPKEAKPAPATGKPEAKPPVKKPQAKPEEKKPAAEEPYTPLTTQSERPDQRFCARGHLLWPRLRQHEQERIRHRRRYEPLLPRHSSVIQGRAYLPGDRDGYPHRHSRGD